MQRGWLKDRQFQKYELGLLTRKIGLWNVPENLRRDPTYARGIYIAGFRADRMVSRCLIFIKRQKMKLFHIRRSGQKCKERCDAYGVALTAVKKLNIRCKELSIEAARYNSLLSTCDKGNIVLGVSQVNNHMVTTMIKDAGGQWGTVSLYPLPYAEYDRPICNMDISYVSKSRTAHIEDWYSEIENMGYGSVLMTHLVKYLKIAGYLYLTGYICPVDFDHEDKLRHFYTKFGFEITTYPDRRVIKLQL
jgi:hypothetical protein